MNTNNKKAIKSILVGLFLLWFSVLGAQAQIYAIHFGNVTYSAEEGGTIHATVFRKYMPGLSPSQFFNYPDDYPATMQIAAWSEVHPLTKPDLLPVGALYGTFVSEITTDHSGFVTF